MFKCYVTACDIEHRTEAKKKMKATVRHLWERKLVSKERGTVGKEKKTGITEGWK